MKYSWNYFIEIFVVTSGGIKCCWKWILYPVLLFKFFSSPLILHNWLAVTAFGVSIFILRLVLANSRWLAEGWAKKQNPEVFYITINTFQKSIFVNLCVFLLKKVKLIHLGTCKGFQAVKLNHEKEENFRPILLPI